MKQTGWAVTEGQDPAGLIIGGADFQFDRVAPEWHGSRKIWKVDYDGRLRDTTDEEYRFAAARLHASAAALGETPERTADDG